jgi:hypothetical protein
MMTMQQQAGFNSGMMGQNPDMAAGAWDDDFDWEAGGPGMHQQAMGMGMGMNAMNAMNGGDWAGPDMGDGSGWAGPDDGMMGQMGGSQMSGEAGGMGEGGMGYGPGPGLGFGPGGMRGGPGPMGHMGPGGLPPGNAAGTNPNACFNCGASDHMARNCPHPKDFATQCHNCGEMGHRAKDCPQPAGQPPPPPLQRPGAGPGWGPDGPGEEHRGGGVGC